MPVAVSKQYKREWIAARLEEHAAAAWAMPVVVAGDLQLGFDDVEALLLSLGGGWCRLPALGFAMVGGGPSGVIDRVLLSTAAAPLVSSLSLHQASITTSPHYPGGFELDVVAPDCEGGTG